MPFCILSMAIFCSAAQFPAREYRYFVITDMTHDDGNSLIRLLLYSNEIDIAAIIVSPQGPEADKYKGWAETIWKKTHTIIDSYDKVDENLRLHHPSFPTADKIRSITKRGKATGAPTRMTGSRDDGNERFKDYIGEDEDSEGSDFLQTLFEDDDPRPIVVGFWGGPWTFTQAFYRFRQKHSERQAQALMDRMIFHCISFQDVTFDYFIDLDAYGRKFYGDFKGTRIKPSTLLIEHFWHNYLRVVRSNDVRKYGGPLGNRYDNGGEGDTPSFLNLISMNLGLSHIQAPELGGWGDLFNPHASLEKVWDAKDPDELARWRSVATNDFFARLTWEEKNYSQANHQPIAVVNGDTTRKFIYLAKQSGQKVELNASGSSDPDDDKLSIHWFQYKEADSYGGSVSIDGAESSIASFVVPSDIGDNEIHIVLEVKDNGNPALVSYRRIIIGPNSKTTTNLCNL